MLTRLLSSLKGFTPHSSRTPTVIQMENTECGAASLGIILAYYGRIVPLPELRRECGVSRDGSKASNVLKAALYYGLDAKGFKMPTLDALKKAQLPCIVFWNFNHFLVVERFRKQGIDLNDPASGRRQISYPEFEQAYTGIALVMEPGSTFQSGGKQLGILPALISRLNHSRRAIAFCFIAGLLLTLPRLAVPAFSQIFVDEILLQNRQEWLRPLIVGMVMTAVLQALLARLRLIYLRRLLVKMSVIMSGQFLWHTLRLPAEFYAQRYAGEISNRAALNNKVAEVITGKLATTVIDMLMIVVYAAIMFAYDKILTVVTISFAALNLVVLKLLSSSRQDINNKLAQEDGKASGVAISGLNLIESIKASGLESDMFSKFAGYYSKVLNAQQEGMLPNQMLTVLPTLLSAIAGAAILIVGGFRVMEGSLTIGMLVAYQALTQSFLAPVNSLVNFGGVLQILGTDLNRLDDVLQNPIDPEVDRTSPRNPSQTLQPFLTAQSFRLQGYVELRHLTFGYSRLSPPLFEDLNLTVSPGQRVAFVGGSGSGKSSVAKLITGLYQPWQGEIYFDGVPRSQIPRAVFGHSLAMVEQDIFLFSGTVRENLTLWDSTIAHADLVQACQDAAIHELILSLPGGYDAVLDEGGMNLSGGQRQRMEIARALVRNPSVLVLDEATSALDAETELAIDRNLRRRGCACIIIAHRLSTIRDCDEIIVLDRGQVVQRGTHEDLRQTGLYRQLTNLAIGSEDHSAA
ncbi:MAG TPA: NHLP family bacteriocin export ABC transporter peptidase/permease/ATPase subunit [Coleofasciculaceae cyanobacterium]